MFARLFCSLLLISGTTAAVKSSLSPSQLRSSSVCPARTVNYITHHLPQQCLATSRGNNLTSAESTVYDATITNLALEETETPSAVLFFSTTTLSATTLENGLIQSQQPETSPDAAASSTAKELAVPSEVREEDSALESGEFLSFEEWKKQNLKKAGQSEHIGQRNNGEAQEQRQRPPRQQNTLESLGDDGEIDIDFAGFVPTGPEQSIHEAPQPLADNQDSASDAKRKLRSKDAGTTCKERFNYASFDCAANVLKWNKEAKSPSSVLSENKDSYMLNQCSAENKHLVLELCNDILVDTVVLANFEFFSSTFRTFRISVSDSYPVKGDRWKTLGMYEARNTREIQAFLVENPLIWARYIRIEFLSHYGGEFYCPVSLVRVHGTTMMEEWKHSEDSASVDDTEDEATTEDEVSVIPSTSVQSADIEHTVPDMSDDDHGVPEMNTHVDDAPTARAAVSTKVINTASPISIGAIVSNIESSNTCKASAISLQGSSTSLPTTTIEPLSSRSVNASKSVAVEDAQIRSTTAPDIQNKTTGHDLSTVTSRSNTSTKIDFHDATTSQIAAPNNTSATDRTKSTGTTSSAAAAPTAQDSFFKSVQKRLQMLEANSSLSLQYIEDQSRALRDAFKKVEQRQLTRTSNFLDALNQTVLNELREFRQQYDQLWQSTVIELESQRERYELDNKAINARIGLLADEVIFQRRMAIMQMVLIVVCLVLVLFSRGAINNYLELPLVQNMLTRSPSSRWLNLSANGLRSDRPSPPTRIRSALQLGEQDHLEGHQRQQSEDSTDAKPINGLDVTHRRMQSTESIDTLSGNELYAPPTPISDYGGPPDFDPSTIERPATSPPTLRVNDEPPRNTDIASEDEIVSPVSQEEEPLDSLPNGITASSSLIRNSSPSKHLTWNLPED